MARNINFRTITQDIQYMKEEPYQCNKCEMVFPPKALLMNYFKTLIGENPCDEVAMFEKALQHINSFVYHLITHAVNKSNQIDLNKTIETTFNTIIDNNDQESDFSDCNASDQESDISDCIDDSSHTEVLKVQEHSVLKPFICSTCDKAFKTRAVLMRHRKIHFREPKPVKTKKEKWRRTNKCPHCDKWFFRSDTLTTHLKKHTGEKPFTCEHCGSGFAYKQSLFRHLETHSLDRKKPHQCDLCNKCFYTDRTLREHKNTHLGEKPHKCRHCDMTFTSYANCLRHKRKHTGEKPYKCRQCSKSYSRPSKCCDGLSTIRETRTEPLRDNNIVVDTQGISCTETAQATASLIPEIPLTISY